MAPAFTTHAPVRRQDGQVWWTPSPGKCCSGYSRYNIDCSVFTGDGAYTGEAQAWNQPAQDDNQQWQATTDNWQPQPADVESESESQSQPQTRESNDSSSLTETSSLSEESQPSITSTTTTKSASIASDSAEELFSTDSAGQNDAKVKAISLSDLSSQSSATSTSATALPDTTPGNFFSEIGRSPTYIAITVVVCLAIASLVLGCLFWLLRRRCQARSKRDRILNTENHWWNRFSGMFICRETSDCDSLSSSCSDHAEKFEPKPFFLYRDNKVSNDSTRSLHPNSRVEEGRAVHNPAFIPHSALAIPPAVHYRE